MTEENVLEKELLDLLEKNFSSDKLYDKFVKRIKEKNLARDENPKSHICIYFCACNLEKKEFFIGHHKKSGLWLFNGGHNDKGENLKEAIEREIDEEWGLNAKDFKIEKPLLLTITEIDNPTKQPCNSHFDFWHFISVDKEKFNPNKENLLAEFHENRWVNLEELKDLCKSNEVYNKAIYFIENKLLK